MTVDGGQAQPAAIAYVLAFWVSAGCAVVAAVLAGVLVALAKAAKAPPDGESPAAPAPRTLRGAGRRSDLRGAPEGQGIAGRAAYA
jgi:hypothetical protein